MEEYYEYERNKDEYYDLEYITEECKDQLLREECQLSINDTIPTARDPATVHLTLKSGAKENILQMLQHKADLSYVCENGDTALHAILSNEKLIERDIIEILAVVLTQGINPNIENNYEQTALHLVVKKRMKDTVSLLLNFGADIRIINKRGSSIAHFFVKDEFEKCELAMRYSITNTLKTRAILGNYSVSFLTFLMSKNANFDQKNEEGESALHLAIIYQLLHILPILLEHTNDIRFIDKNNKTLLHYYLMERSLFPNEHPHSDNNSRYVARCVNILLRIATGEHNCTLILLALKLREEMEITETLMSNLNKCNDKNLATTLFHELLSAFTLWRDSQIDYFLTILRDLASKSVHVNNELLRKKIVFTEREVKNQSLLKFLKENNFAYRIQSYNLRNFLYEQCKRNGCEGSSSEWFSHIYDFAFSGDCEVTDECGKSTLQTAASYGDVSMTRILIRLGASVNHRDDSKRTPLHDAVMMRQSAEVVGLLLSNGADVNAKDDAGETPLHSAVSQNNVAIVQLLLQNGATVRSKNECLLTLLHPARWPTDNAAEMVALLVSNGADVNAVKNRAGGTPLHEAVSRNDVIFVRSLIEIGASASCKDDFQQTPLHCVRWPTDEAVEMVALLLANGADVNAQDYAGETPLHLAVSDGNAASCSDQHQQSPLHRVRWKMNGAAEIVDFLLTSGADVNARNNKNETALHEAASTDNISVVLLLIGRGASVNCKDNFQRTPLHRALLTEASMEIAQLLLTSGADANAIDREGNRPLHYIAKIRTSHFVCECVRQMLLERGAYVNARNNRGESALFHALSFENLDLIVGLIKYGADLNDPSVRKLFCSRGLIDFRRHHRVKLKAASLLHYGKHRSYAIYIVDQEHHEDCLKEVIKLKSTSIDDHKSLYDFLQMHPKRRCYFVDGERLQKLIDSKRLNEQFPLYSVIILGKYHEAVTRKSLLGLAREALYRLIQTRLPDAVDQVLDYLADVDWINLIEAGAD